MIVGGERHDSKTRLTVASEEALFPGRLMGQLIGRLRLTNGG